MTKLDFYELALVEALKVPPEDGAAASLLEQAAELDDHRAISALASWKFEGKFYEKDGGQALKLWERAADLGNEDAMLRLGIIYERGMIGRKSYKKAFYNYLRAAMKGSAQANYELSRFFYYGFYVKKSKFIAKWFLDQSFLLGYKEN